MNGISVVRLPLNFLAGLFLLAFASNNVSATTITNLSSDQVSVAVYRHQAYSSNSGGLAVVTPEGFVFTGWYNLAPGETLNQGAGWKYVERNGRAVTWSSLDTSTGIIRNGQRFSELLSRSNFSADLAKAVDRGFERTEFMKFTDGHFNITGDNAYEIITKTFQFDDESRSIKFIGNQFRVDGHIVDYSVSANNHRASISWSANEKNGVVSYSGSIEGKQSTPFAARDKAYYSGSVKVRYTRRN